MINQVPTKNQELNARISKGLSNDRSHVGIKTDRPLVERGTLFVMGGSTIEASHGHPFERPLADKPKVRFYQDGKVVFHPSTFIHFTNASS